jgi:bifunctional UDP-N-acetylglucosamine pyrophosphorylase/glucosamine-1-phosphate N-acetyltransferase
MTRIIILAAGRGTRMNYELPKSLVPLQGRPMIKYLMDSIVEAGIDPRPIMVVSPDNADLIKKELKEYSLEYVVQEQALGTGHAVSTAQHLLDENVNSVLVLYGDHPFLTGASLKKCAAAAPESLIMLTTKLDDFDDWRHNFYHWGRIVRNSPGDIARIVEFKDASEEERLITEVNPAVMCFNRTWLKKNLSQLDNANSQGEYYLTDLVKIAFNEGHPVHAIAIAPPEAMGINSLAELKVAESLLDQK